MKSRNDFRNLVLKAAATSAMVALALTARAEQSLALPSFAQIQHSDSLSPVKPEFQVGKTFSPDSAKSESPPGWSPISSKLAGRWKLVRMHDSFTDAFDVEKLSDLPTVDKRNTQMVLGLRQDANENIWDSEDLNKTQVDKISPINLINGWKINVGKDHSMSMMQQRTSLELNTTDNTIKRVYLSETIVDFDLNSANKLVAKVSTKWFTPDGEAVAISRSTREYERVAPFKDVRTLNGVDVKTSFDTFIRKPKKQ